jgi:hypothetical protein
MRHREDIAMRLSLALSLVLLFVSASPATAERPRRVISEEAFAMECRTTTISLPSIPSIPSDPTIPSDPGNPSDPSNPTSEPAVKRVCATVQVVRSRFSDGIEDTMMFFSLTENDVEIPVFASSFFPIDSQYFVMDRDGTRAILSLPSPAEGPSGATAEGPPAATVVWDATDDFSSRSFSTEVVREKTEEGFIKSRLTEREQQLSANAEGVVVPVTDADGVVRSVTFNTGAPAEGTDFASATLIIRKTISRTRLLEEGQDFFDLAE